MYSNNTGSMRYYIAGQLKTYGINVDINNGKILNYSENIKLLQCRSLYLLRHAETIGTKEKRFMSDSSSNAVLTEQGIANVKLTANLIEKMQFDYVLYSLIPRVKQTAEIIKQYENYCNNYIEIPWMNGIDNAGWEGKTVAELNGKDQEDFYQREILHNIFARSSKGCSWGEVLLRCIDLIEYINAHLIDKKVLLISQGSIFVGLRLLLHLEDKLWGNYDAESFFGLNNNKSQNYGKLQYIFGENIKV